MDDDVRLIHGDCLEVMKTMGSGSIDAIVTDPPWMYYQTGWYDASDHHNSVDYLSPDKYAFDFFRLLKDDTSCLLWCRWDCFEQHCLALSSVGFNIKNCIVWAKAYHTAGDLEGNLGAQHEMAVFATKGRWKRHGKRETNLWIDVAQPFSKAKRIHPTEKPLALMKRSVELACPRGGLVLDPFAGSGTTLVASLKNGRRAIGIELDEKYIEPAIRRIEGAKTPLFAFNDPTGEDPEARP